MHCYLQISKPLLRTGPAVLVDTNSNKRIDRFRREHNLVRLLLRTFGLLAKGKLLVAMQDQRHDLRYLTLHAWRAFYPEFPIHLGYELLYGLGNLSPAAKMRRLATESWHDFAGALSTQTLQDGRPFGVVFPCKGLRYGLMIHNGRYQCRRYPLHQHRFEADDGSILTIEPAPNVIHAIHESGWEPGMSWEACESRIDQSPLLRQVKNPAAKLVLSLFVQVLNGDIERHPDWLGGEYPDDDDSLAGGILPGETVVRTEGLRYVRLSQQEVADALGLSHDQVRCALRHLREAGVIDSQQREGAYLHRVLTTEE